MSSWNAVLQRVLTALAGWPWWVRFALTIAVMLLTGSAWRHLEMDRPFLFFFPAIIFCAVLFEYGTGYVATAVAALFMIFDMMNHGGTFSGDRMGDRIALLFFVTSGLVISLLVDSLRLRIEDLVHEKERSDLLAHDHKLLIDELAHRTRNDLANVVTLLRLQSATSGADCREALRAASERVQSIARVHRQLEVRGDRVVVDSRDYLQELCGDLQLSRLADRPIRMECKAESHPIGLEKAVPIGLIVNELVTNATKHAFPDGRAGQIMVSFIRMGGHYRLSVEDDGIGAEALGARREGLGSKLLGLLAGQLGSQFELHPGANGTVAYVEIPVRANRQRADK